MSTLLILFGSLVAILVGLLAIPIDLAFRLDRTDQVGGRLDFRWLFGLVRFGFDIPVTDNDHSPTTIKEKPKKQRPRQRKSRGKPGNVLAVLRQTGFRRRLRKFFRDVLRATHARELFIHLRIGLGDPADTGRLWGFIGPVAALATNIESARIEVEPEFMDLVLEIHSRGRFRFIPLQFIFLTIVFILSPTSLRAWRTLRQGETG